MYGGFTKRATMVKYHTQAGLPVAYNDDTHSDAKTQNHSINRAGIKK
jgi:hypothetical protein